MIGTDNMKANSSPLIALGLIAVLTIVPAVLQGRYVSRWGEPAEQATAATALEDFPRQLGEWVAVADGDPLSERIEQELGLEGYMSRIYRNTETGREASVLLMVGEAGPLVRHPPEICYGSRENNMLGSRQTKVATANGSESDFRLLSYAPSSQLASPFTVAYAWTSDGVWSVPDWPRVAYGGEPVLYKVQIQMAHSELDSDEPDKEFIGVLEEFAGAFSGFVGS